MIVPYNPQDTSEFYETYYAHQVGDGLAVYSGRPIMDGDGLGSFLGGVFKSIAPALKGVASSAVKTVGKQALNVARDVIAGDDFKSSALRGLKNVGGEVMRDVVSTVAGSGNFRKRRARPSSVNKGGGGRKKRRHNNRPVLDM